LSHPDLAQAPADAARREIFASKDILEARLGAEVLAFAYPYGSGAFSPRIRGLIREAGYVYDFSVKQGISPWPWDREAGSLKRLLVRGGDSGLDFHLDLTRGRAHL